MNVKMHNEIIQTWKLQELENCIDEFEDFICERVNGKVPGTPSLDNSFLHIAGNICRLARSVLALSAVGYAESALALTRSIYENAVVLAFFNSKISDENLNEYVADYYLAGEYRYLKSQRQTYEKIGDLKQENDINKKMKELEEKAYKRHKEIKGDYWWAGCKRFCDLENYFEKEIQEVCSGSQKEKIAFVSTVAASYKIACSILHSNSLGNASRLGELRDDSIADTGPHINGHSVPLETVANCLIYIFGTLYSFWGLDSSRLIERLKGLSVFYASKMREETPSEGA